MDPGSIPGGDMLACQVGLSWSSGLGRHPLTVEIEGSSPSGSECLLLLSCVWSKKALSQQQRIRDFEDRKKSFLDKINQKKIWLGILRRK